jgi:hypothetical protein
LPRKPKEEDIQETVFFGRLLQGVQKLLVGYIVKEIKIEEEYGIDPPIIGAMIKRTPLASSEGFTLQELCS